MTLILETNDLPIKEILICHGWCGGQGGCGKWCPNADYYAKCTVINTPNTHIVSAYRMLEKIEKDILNNIEIKLKLKKIISEFGN